MSAALRLFVELLVAPGRVVGRAPGARTVRAAAGWMLLPSVVWSGFSLELYLDGRSPAFGSVLPVASHYLWQAALLPVVLLGAWLIYAAVAHPIARAFGGQGRFADTLIGLGCTYGPPLLVAYVVPDLILYMSGGLAALSSGAKWLAPVVVLWALGGTTKGLGTTQRLSLDRAFLASFVGFVVQSWACAMVLR